MKNSEAIRELFENDLQANYDFIESSNLVKYKKECILETKLCEKDRFSKWAKIQDRFINVTKTKTANIFSKEYVEEGITKFNSFFETRGPLKGNILDIGGGWGLFRQWWEPNYSDVFVVHDPGIERFLRGAYEVHEHYYKKAFSLPMTFVEGMGEELPYKSNIFDTCLIAHALDHCFDIKKVLAETYRCLKGNGTILIIQSCPQTHLGFSQKMADLHILNRIWLYFCNPTRILAKIRNAGHLNHFSLEDIIKHLEEAGFSDIRKILIPNTEGLWAFEAKKKASESNV